MIMSYLLQSNKSKQNRGIGPGSYSIITRVYDMTRKIWLQPCKSIEEVSFVYGISTTSIRSILNTFRKRTDNPKALRSILSPITNTTLTFRPADAAAVEIIKERRDN